MKRSPSGGAAGHNKNEAPVDQYRKEIGKHQEVIENPQNVKKRQVHKEKVRGEHTTEKPQDFQTSLRKTVTMILVWALLVAGAYYFIQQLMKPTEHPFTGDGKYDFLQDDY